MLIGYRRLSGKVDLTDQDQGKRGSWWEKRIALLKRLNARGHEVQVLGPESIPRPLPLLLVEFGSVNQLFHEKTLDLTRRWVSEPHVRAIFLCDDPDLEFPFWEATHPDTRWSIWANAYSYRQRTKTRLIPAKDFPFSCLQEPRPPKPTPSLLNLVYIGRPNSRKKVFESIFQSNVPVRIYGKESEWEGFDTPVWEPPTQVERSMWYQNELACLGIADRKHKEFGWRTGRVFHAILAGCPAIVEADHHPKVLEVVGESFRHPSELFAFLVRMKNPGLRTALVQAQQSRLRAEATLVEARFNEATL